MSKISLSSLSQVKNCRTVQTTILEVLELVIPAMGMYRQASQKADKKTTTKRAKYS